MHNYIFQLLTSSACKQSSLSYIDFRFSKEVLADPRDTHMHAHERLLVYDMLWGVYKLEKL